MMALTNWDQDVGAQNGGQCLLRTRDITDLGSWRAWNGSAFSVTINVSAEIAPVSNPDAHTCTVINLIFRHSSYFNKFLAFGEKGKDWSFSLSDDLIEWSEPVSVE